MKTQKIFDTSKFLARPVGIVSLGVPPRTVSEIKACFLKTPNIRMAPAVSALLNNPIFEITTTKDDYFLVIESTENIVGKEEVRLDEILKKTGALRTSQCVREVAFRVCLQEELRPLIKEGERVLISMDPIENLETTDLFIFSLKNIDGILELDVLQVEFDSTFKREHLWLFMSKRQMS